MAIRQKGKLTIAHADVTCFNIKDNRKVSGNVDNVQDDTTLKHRKRGTYWKAVSEKLRKYHLKGCFN